MAISRSRPYTERGRFGGLARIIGFVLLAIVAAVLGVLLLFKALDWATGSNTGPDGHVHVL